MLERFFLWRAHRQDAKRRYKLPREPRRGPFAAGFFTMAKSTRFWDRYYNTFERRRARRRWVRRALLIGGTVFLLWVIWESLIGLRHF
ncbi:MAG: hypothetical protein Q7P63_00730 [Verrucomicrobiota bacterium JB022]|nr:hypothetical protein [Verrucomicrobiota bacterium JB022]